MINISRRLARRLRTMFQRTVGRSPRPIALQAGPCGLLIGIYGPHAAVEYRHAGSYPAATFAAPFELLKTCEGANDSPLTLEPDASSVTARWDDSGVPQVVTFDRTENFELPPRSGRMESNDSRLVSSRRDAAGSADADSIRYALACVQFRGDSGRIAATDARELFLEDDFTFPWTDELLVPACPVLASPKLFTGQPVALGRTKDWVTLTTGPWTVHLRIEKGGRFPDVKVTIPETETARSIIRLDAADCEFLAGVLPKLPSHSEPVSPLTFDLNGRVAVRSRGEGQSHVTEVVLTNSRSEGELVVCQVNTKLLARALRLGFREMCLFDPQSPVLFSDGRRKFIWMPLYAASAVPADPNAVRIESPASAASAPSISAPTPEAISLPKQKRRHRTVPAARSNSTCHSSSFENGQHEADGQPANSSSTNGDLLDEQSAQSPSLMEQFAALRNTLKAAVSQTDAAIRAIKRQRREQRLLRATRAAIQQLQTIGTG